MLEIFLIVSHVPYHTYMPSMPHSVTCAREIVHVRDMSISPTQTVNYSDITFVYVMSMYDNFKSDVYVMSMYDDFEDIYGRSTLMISEMCMKGLSVVTLKMST